MSIVANTFQTYQAKGNREDLANVIYNIDPVDTPFISNAGRGKASNTYFEWQTDVLASAVSTNQHIEGDDITSFDAVTPTVRMGNYTQISRATVIIAGSQEAMDKAGRKSEIAYQISKKSAELKRDMEKSLLENQAAAAGTTSTARVTGSLSAFIKTNTNINTTDTGANPTYTTVPNDTRTDASATRTFTETLLKDVVQQCWASGAKLDTLMVGGTQKQVVSTFSGIATKTLYQTAAKQAAIIGAADVYVSDFGTLSVVPNRFQRARDAFLIDWEYVSVDYLRPFMDVPLAKTGDAEKRMLLVEYGLRVKNEKALGIVADIG